MVQDGEVLSVSIGVADDQVEYDGIEQLEDIECGSKGDGAEKAEAVRQRRAALARVFELRGHGERLTEVFLMDAPDAAIGASGAVVPLDQKKLPVCDDVGCR